MIDPWQVGLDHEASAQSADRQARGAWYTPRRLVERLVALAIPDRATLPELAIDPACGGGAFLLGVLDRMVELGVAPDDALSRVAGTDIDAGAVAAANRALAAWAQSQGLDSQAAAGRVSQADALAFSPAPAPALVIGNPPFITPLKGRSYPEEAEARRAAQPARFGPYADLAAIHLGAAFDRCAPGGRVAFVLPQSMLAARDVAGLRAEVEPATVAVWATAALLFDANVRVWAPVLVKGASEKRAETPAQAQAPLVRVAAEFDRTRDHDVASAATWPSLVAGALGAPAVELDGEPLGDRITVTAGFRDEFYAMAEACRELRVGAELGEDEAKIVTVGAIDPLHCYWGERPTRFAKNDWNRPIVSVADLGSTEPWLRRQLVPKVLLPTQSKIFEPLIDADGILAPVTPVLALTLNGGATPGTGPLTLEHLAVMLLAPPLSAWAFRRWFGSAMSVSAMKLSARAVAELPMPTNRELWDRAANALRAGATVEELAAMMVPAYVGAEGDATVLAWWQGRRPS